MRRFTYFEPATLAEASRLLAGGGQALAGGTDLLVELKEQLRRADCVVNIKKIPGIDGLSYDPRKGLRIGALATAREVETAPFVLQHYASLAQAARELGSIQVRNRATIVGNICRASPSADTIPPLMADEARVQTSQRTLPLDRFFLGPGKTLLSPGEIVIAITVPPPAAGTKKIYIKHGRRKAMELATVGVAVTLTRDAGVRIVLGAVAPTPMRAKKAEEAFRTSIEAAAQAAADESRPISNVRASADYRREMVRVLTRRALEQALAACS